MSDFISAQIQADMISHNKLQLTLNLEELEEVPYHLH